MKKGYYKVDNKGYPIFFYGYISSLGVVPGTIIVSSDGDWIEGENAGDDLMICFFKEQFIPIVDPNKIKMLDKKRLLLNIL